MFLAALLIGLVAGSRALTAPAAVSWGAHAGFLPVADTWLSFMGSWWAPWLFTLLALGELVTDQLPTTPSRKVPMQFVARLCTGALSGATIGAASGGLVLGAICGVIGAVVGTLAGAWFRGRLAALAGNDHIAATVEDALAIGLAVLVVVAL